MSASIISGLTTLYADPLGKTAIIGLGGALGITAIFRGNDIINDLRYYLFAGGSAALGYVGAHMYLKESCDKKSEFSCKVLDSVDSGLAVISAIFGVAVIANAFIRLVTHKSIIDIIWGSSEKSSQKIIECAEGSSQKAKNCCKK